MITESEHQQLCSLFGVFISSVQKIVVWRQLGLHLHRCAILRSVCHLRVLSPAPCHAFLCETRRVEDQETSG